MISDSHTRYGSRSWRQGRSRRLWSYHDSKRCRQRRVAEPSNLRWWSEFIAGWFITRELAKDDSGIRQLFLLRSLDGMGNRHPSGILLLPDRHHAHRL